MTKKTPVVDVAAERERQNKLDVKGVRAVTKRGGEIAKGTLTYEPQRKGKPDWLKPPKS
ncbi:hypothetical protein ACVIGB_006599 [Bradyrhizobium sp. USDA 4341]